jgi:hypothetical protein
LIPLNSPAIASYKPKQPKNTNHTGTMKVAITAILALAGAAMVAANDFPDNMPVCGVSSDSLDAFARPGGFCDSLADKTCRQRTCGTNMLAKAAELGCGDNDIACLCKNKDFGYGIRDCSVQSCATIEQANLAIAWGNNLCSSVSVTANIASATAVAVSVFFSRRVIIWGTPH